MNHSRGLGDFHYVSTIPPQGEPYIAHPYTLLQVKGLVGRKGELEMLTDWVTKPKHSVISLFNIVAIGGMGKSALTWTWFNNIAPQEKKWEGRVWWSFYESDATFENFITRTLAYVSGRSPETLKDHPRTREWSTGLPDDQSHRRARRMGQRGGREPSRATRRHVHRHPLRNPGDWRELQLGFWRVVVEFPDQL